MPGIKVGDEITITVPLICTKIGTADLEVEYEAGKIRRKLYLPKNICVIKKYANTEIPNFPDASSLKTHQHPEAYICDICGKVCTAKIALLGHKRSHLPKKPVGGRK